MRETGLDLKKLNDFIKALKNPPQIRVGVLGGQNSRQDGNSNAEIGAEHEFGTLGKPERSFLRMPLTQHLSPAIEKSGDFTDDQLKKCVAQKSIKPLADILAVLSESVVQEAFMTGGFGQWPKWSNPSYQNNTGMVLQDTLQLRNSITSEVK